ncbi:hypothetical protein DPMN_151260 [Dreissena polymorpha]|uniref:Uncharacterized protein n=1 Tax=Dreissena polymorpha TaxID=45954 RepID=A0A9D4J434_DREPO|nr:hypothetical protein DPMN_151260 [Dreissena polymorpha]
MKTKRYTYSVDNPPDDSLPTSIQSSHWNKAFQSDSLPTVTNTAADIPPVDFQTASGKEDLNKRFGEFQELPEDKYLLAFLIAFPVFFFLVGVVITSQYV